MPLAVVIGANRGIGLGLARELRKLGYDVIGSVRDPAKASDLAATGAAVEPLDVNDQSQESRFCARVGASPIDVLVVNAGVAGPKHHSAQETTAEEIGALFYTNAIAPVRIARSLLPAVERAGGVIGFMSSIMGSVSLNESGGQELYRASKAALNSLIRSFAAELSGKRVTLLTLHPGWVRTDMGGQQAPLDVGTSTRGLAAVITGAKGKGGLRYVDYAGKELTW